MTRLFIYGTLKRGCSSHAHLQGQRFLGEARTQPGYALYSLGSYPGLVVQPTDRVGVCGEIWEVDEAALARLDDFEGVPEGLYRREPVALLPPHEHERAEAFFYVRPIEAGQVIGPVWRE
jgi:gamma-glutamylcyclotransferase (GGCT)/AIG2-like uncharacterized protein YtfP